MTDHIDGAALLDEVDAFHRRFTIFPTNAAYVAVALWAAHTHLLDGFTSTPRLALLSDEPSSGKSRALQITATLVPRPTAAVNPTPKALVRAVSARDGHPTILLDEADTVFSSRTKGSEELRGLLTAGHRRSSTMLRCAGEAPSTRRVRKFSPYCAVALAGLGSLPETILARSVAIRMRRRATNERVEPYRRRIHEAEGHALRDRLAVWADQVGNQVTDASPELPDSIFGRPADVWEPLLAVAEAAGGTWPQRARAACAELAAVAMQDDANETRKNA
ncbi:DNA primase [Streptomyces sp. CB02959]|nr:DNA primase [Streptomyces sp. CB02959]